LASLDPDTVHDFCIDFGAAQEAVQAGVVSQRSTAADTHWGLWADFCLSLTIDPLLSAIQDPVALLQVYAQRYRTGKIAPSKKSVRSRTVEDALRSVGQTFAGMGSPDPRLTTQGKIDFRIQRQLSAYTKQDPPPNRVKPVPVSVIRHVMYAAHACHLACSLAVADMIAVAFFFLLRPGEYTGSVSDTAPFRFCDVQLFIGPQRLPLSTASEADLHAATFATLTFTTQKNGVRGEVIGLSRSGNIQLCPVLSIVRRIVHLRQHNAPTTAPLASYYSNGRWKTVTPGDITSTLRVAVDILGPALGFLSSDISARSLRASGAMALLCAQVDTDVIRLLGRWRSDEMLRYLHIQAEPVMRDFAARMLLNGNFVLTPNQDVPCY
jgi:hypothetical protein